MANTALLSLADDGLLTYNTFDFGRSRSMKLSGEFVYDEAGRAVIATKYTLSVSAVITASTAGAQAGWEDLESTAISNARKKLSVPGQALHLGDLGIGDTTLVTSVTVGGVVKSVTHTELEWGPKPISLELTPLGGNIAYEVVWVCTFQIHENASALPLLACIAFNYDCEYGMDDKGLWSRTISGYAQIKQARAVSGAAVTRTVSTIADKLRNQLSFFVPLGFKVTGQRYHTNSTKNRLEFTHSIQQLGGAAPPPGIVDWDCDIRISNVSAGNFRKWKVVIPARFEVRPGFHKSMAAAAFFNIVRSKIIALKKDLGPADTLVPEHLELGDSASSRKASFAMSFAATGCIKNILTGSGLWSPVEGSDLMLAWKTSMEPLWKPRGYANLGAQASEDRIVDPDGLGVIANIGQEPGAAVGHESAIQPVNIQGIFGGAGINEGNSWFAYESRVHFARYGNVTVHKVMRLAGVAVGLGWAYDLIQQSTGPSPYVILYGKSIRLKFRDPQIPWITSVRGGNGEVEVTEVDRKVDGPKQIGCFFAIPAYLTRWAIAYRLKADPGDAYVPKITRADDACCAL